MCIDDNYDDDIEGQNTHPNLLPPESQECATTVSTEDKMVLAKAGDIGKVMAVTKAGLPNVTRKHQVTVVALSLKTMVR